MIILFFSIFFHAKVRIYNYFSSFQLVKEGGV